MKLLLVEDNEKLLQSLIDILTSQKYLLDTAKEGESGLDLALSNSYDLIILDIGLPKLNGFEIIKEIRSQKITTPILVLTARDAISDKINGLDLGASDYLTKPFDPQELLARIRALIRQNTTQKSNIITVKNLKLDTKNKTVTQKNKELILSAKEYTLLEYFCLNIGNILTKQQIIDHCWDESLDPFSNTPDVYIGYLRKKLGKNFIVTIKNLGYKLTP